MNSDKIRYFFPKLKIRFMLERTRLWKKCNVERIADRGYKPFKNADALKKRMQTMLGPFDASMLSGISADDKAVILSSANQSLHHEFDLLGSGPVRLDPIDWHVDFKTGARWPKRFYREIGSIKGADIKVPWELSRCQHLLWLGEAYLISKEERYAQEIIDEISCWIDDNPLMYSVNWTCAMDVAIRAVNWMFALNMIASYSGFNDSFASKACHSLWQHGFFIVHNLEKSIPYSKNHYASDVVGLLFIGVLFDDTRKGGIWKKKALNEFYSEIRTQVLPSGVHYERSVSYHRLMTELFSYPVYMLQRMGACVPQDVITRIQKMYEYIAAYTKPNGLAPLIADNDDGRFLPFLRRDFRKHGYLNDKDSVENRIVAVGMKPYFCTSLEGNVYYKDAGVAIVKQDNVYVFINNGGYSGVTNDSQSRIQSHTHNDLLSFEFNVGGKDIIIDPGAYLYTSSETERNSFRSTSKHNTVVVDAEEQNGFVSPFSLKRNVRKIGLREINNEEYEGEYITNKGNLHHVRKFKFEKQQLIITDFLTKEGDNHKAIIYFHFAEGVFPEINDGVITMDEGVSISFIQKPNQLVIEDDTTSPSYGVLANCKTAKVVFEFKDDVTIKTTINYCYESK